MVCGTTSDAGKSLVVAGMCRLLARNGVRVAPFKAQNMANNAAVTADGAEIGHAQWIQALAAGVEPSAAMNPVLLKPTGERTSQVVVRGRPIGEMSAQAYHQAKPDLRPVVLDALAELRSTYDVVICEGAGSPAEINLLDRDLVNLGLADAAGLPAVVVGDIDRGGVFAALYGTVALLPDRLRARVRGFVVNRLRGDPALLGSACDELERRCGVPTLGVLPYLRGMGLDAEDSLALDRPDDAFGDDIDNVDADAPGDDPVAIQDAVRRHPGFGGPGLTTGPSRSVRGIGRSAPEPGNGDVLDVVAVRWPYVANAGDLDPLRIEPWVQVRWVRSLAELGRPDLVVLPGSKATRADLDWFRRSGLAEAVARLGGVPVVAICAGLQMCGRSLHDPSGVEGPPGASDGLDWLSMTTEFRADKVLDRPAGRVVDGPGAGEQVAGYRIHHGRVTPLADGAAGVAPWLEADDGAPLGWWADDVCGSSMHGLFEDDGFRSAVLAWVAGRAGKRWAGSGASFAAARLGRLDRIADAIETHLDLDRLGDLIRAGEISAESAGIRPILPQFREVTA